MEDSQQAGMMRDGRDRMSVRSNAGWIASESPWRAMETTVGSSDFGRCFKECAQQFGALES